jgi:nucleoside-triphosphatase THEP1
MTLGAWNSGRQGRRGDVAPRGRLLVLTGQPGSGKTTRCRQLVQEARGAGLAVRGIVTIDEHAAAGVMRWTEDLRTGERILLGRKAPAGETALGGPRWSLDEAALERCDAILTSACPADLLVIDEVGPVELLHRRGALAGVRRALSGTYDVAVVVVRPWLVPRFTELFPEPDAEVVNVRDTGVLGRLLAAVIVREPA